MASITHFGKTVVVYCDRKCTKAWGVNSRPTRNKWWESKDEEPIYYEDNELGNAPMDPGTYEGGEGKPKSPDNFPNKWYVRECERCRRL